MTTKTLFVLTLTTGTILGAAAFAESHKGHGMKDGKGHMMDMMHHMHSQMHKGDHSGMRKDGNPGMKGGMGKMGGAMHKMLDADGDGMVTPEEASTQLQVKLKQYDSDASGTLSISEYEALYNAMIREKMVDQFQHLDADGDGQVTPDEMNAPADRMKRMAKMRMKMKPKTTTTTQEDDMSTMDHDPSAQEN